MREKWETKYSWKEDDIERQLNSKDALPEMIQDYEVPMVIIGSDVANLYPSREDDKIVDCVEWEEIDYREGARYPTVLI